MASRWTTEEIAALVAGELSDEAAERVVAALALDPAAAVALEDCLQQRAIGHELAVAAPASTAPPADLDRARARQARSRRWFALLPLAAGAAASIIYMLGSVPAADVDARFVAALAPHRQLQPRLSWPAADRHRPYDPVRADAHRAETLSFDLLAAVEDREPRGVAAADILIGNLGAAATELARAPASPARAADAASDRAAVALLEGQPERAITEASAALALAPWHAQALWNRGLAEQALGLDRSAAATFDALAVRDEPGWSDEARDLATALHANRRRRDAAWAQVQIAGQAMAVGGAPPLADVAMFPGMLRLYFYDAVRAATTPARVRAYAPLAAALDARFGGDHLARYVERVAAAPFAVRAGLAARYANLVRGALSSAAAAALLRDARDAHADDIVLGALLWTSATGSVAPADLDEYARLAAATGDPWFDLLAAEQRGAVALELGRPADAQRVLSAAAARCAQLGIAYRCASIERRLAIAYSGLGLPAAAADALARVRAAAGGVLSLEDSALVSAALVASARDDVAAGGGAAAAAYLGEIERSPLPCANAAIARDAVATTLINQHRLLSARALLADAPPCDAPLTLHRMLVPVQLVDHADRTAVAALRARLDTMRAAPAATFTPGELALVDHLEGRLLLPDAPDTGRALLRRAIATPARDPSALKARAYSYSVLVEDAGRHGQWADAIALLAEERGAPVPVTCALGAAEETATVFVARGPGGADVGAVIPRAVGELLGARPVPPALLAALAGCATIDVLARQPFYGAPALLPAATAWRYRTGPMPATVSASAQVLVIGNVPVDPALNLMPLGPIAAAPDAELLGGAEATPRRALDAMQGKGFIEIHAHGLTDVGDNAAVLVLAAEPTGDYALTSAAIARTVLPARPVVVLAACGAAATGHSFQTTWGLVDAFLVAGARAVIASPEPIADAAAPRFFAGVRERITAGAAPASAVRDERAAWTDPSQRAWINRIVVFQ